MTGLSMLALAAANPAWAVPQAVSPAATGSAASGSTAPTAVPPPSAAEPQAEPAEFVIVGTRDANAVRTDVPPDRQLDAETIAGYGVSSVDDLLNALTPLTQSSRGSGPPVILVNGRRVSSFREVHNLPPEAIKKVEIYPEEVAVSFGYRPDQRVINFILKDNFRSLAAEGKYGVSLSGGRDRFNPELGAFLLQKSGRIDIKAEYDRRARLYEGQRGLPGGDYRTLLDRSEDFLFETTVQHYIGKSVSATANGSYQSVITTGAAGPSGISASPDDGFCANPSPLLCDGRIDSRNKTQTLHGGLTFNGDIGKWRWNVAANHDRAFARRASDRLVSLRAGPSDTSYGRTLSSNASMMLSGPLTHIKAGPLHTSLTVGINRYDYFGRSDRNSGLTVTDLGRTQGNVQGSLDIPIARAREDVLPFLGDLTLNANVNLAQMSDFGGLVDFGSGLNWSPVKRLSFGASLARDEQVPSVAQLGSPVIVTPQRTVYDFRSGQTVLAESVSGGNPALRAQGKRSWKLTASYNPAIVDGLRLSVDYNNQHISDPIAGLPLLTPEVEAAFPGRVRRDANGVITRVDYRPVNFFGADTQTLRFGFNLFKSTAPSPPPGGVSAQGRPASGGGGGGGGGGFGPGRPGGGRSFGGAMGGGGPMGGGGASGWNLSLYDTVTLVDRIAISRNGPVLDLLDGSATGTSGGTPRHLINADAGWFAGGFGLRAAASYRSATRASTLRFGDVLTLNLRGFVNLGQQKALVKDIPWLANTRLALSVDNITNAVQRVTDARGTVPLTYDPGYLNPLGRYVEVSFRKSF